LGLNWKFGKRPVRNAPLFAETRDAAASQQTNPGSWKAAETRDQMNARPRPFRFPKVCKSGDSMTTAKMYSKQHTVASFTKHRDFLYVLLSPIAAFSVEASRICRAWRINMGNRAENGGHCLLKSLFINNLSTLSTRIKNRASQRRKMLE
jgi:hypothetical protein